MEKKFHLSNFCSDENFSSSTKYLKLPKFCLTLLFLPNKTFYSYTMYILLLKITKVIAIILVATSLV